jgi:cell wall-associated NlpC family hydrolase
MTAHSRLAQLTRRGESGAATLAMVIAVAGAALLLLVPLLLTAGTSAFNSGTCGQLTAAQQPAPSAAADGIPRNYLSLYQQAGRSYGIPWTVLAAIGKVESDHGRNDGPSSAGALGPMQFLPSTWATYGEGGNIDNPADAIPAAARYLLANGAPSDLAAAIFAYNHSPDYVSTVLSWASTYASGGFSIGPAQQAGTSCALATAAQAPSQIAAKIIAYAFAQVGKPYQWGATGPDAFDCSGLVYAAYRSVGIILPRTTFGMWPLQPHIPEGQEQPGDLVFFNTGPGTAPNHPGHVGLVIGGGKMVVASSSVTTMSYRNNPTLVGFVRPLADRALTGHLSEAT